MRGVGSGNDGLHDTIDIVKDVIVPKSQYEVAVRFEIGGPDRVLCDTLSTPPTVQLLTMRRAASQQKSTMYEPTGT